MSETLLFKKDGLSYHILTPNYRDAALVVLSRAFCTEPITNGAKDPNMKGTFLDWTEFMDFWMDHCSSNGMSVFALDEETHQIAGVCIVHDLIMVNEGFDKTYNLDEKALTPIMQLVWVADKEAIKRMPELAVHGKAIDLFCLGVHPAYRGKKIANSLVQSTLPLCKKAGFKYATIEATSFFTSKAAIFNDFDEIYSMEAKDWEWKGAPVFTNTEPPHGKVTFWVRDLDTV